MPDTLMIVKQRFIKGLHEAPYEFVAPLIVAARGGKAAAAIIAKRLDQAMIEAREKACRGVARK